MLKIKKIFSISNIKKLFVLFIIGLSLRILINNFLNVNVFTDYFHYVSLMYYLFMSFLINVLNNYYDYMYIPSDLQTKNFKFYPNKLNSPIIFETQQDNPTSSSNTNNSNDNPASSSNTNNLNLDSDGHVYSIYSGNPFITKNTEN